MEKADNAFDLEVVSYIHDVEHIVCVLERLRLM